MKRGLASVFAREDLVIVPSDTKVDRADPQLLPFRDRHLGPVPCREDVEDEGDGSVELPRDHNFAIIRQVDDWRSMRFLCHWCSPVLVALGGRHPTDSGGHSTLVSTVLKSITPTGRPTVTC